MKDLPFAVIEATIFNAVASTVNLFGSERQLRVLSNFFSVMIMSISLVSACRTDAEGIVCLQERRLSAQTSEDIIMGFHEDSRTCSVGSAINTKGFQTSPSPGSLK